MIRNTSQHTWNYRGTHKYAPILFMAACLILSPSAAYAETPPRDHILVLNSYHKGLNWTDNVVTGIDSVLATAEKNIERHSEYLDTKRYYSRDYYQRLYEILKLKFTKASFDVVITSDNNAFNFVREYHNELFPDTPVVFCGINNFSETMLKGHKLFTGVIEEIDIKSTLAIALTLHPDITTVVSVNDKTTTGLAVKSEVLATAPLFADRVDFDYIEDFDFEELKERVWKLPGSSIILLSVVTRDRSGNFFAHEESLAHIYSETNVPIYSFWDIYLGKGIVGGMLTSGYHQGESAAQIALRILQGEPVEDIPVVTESPNTYMFDYQQLKLFSINESDLPDNSIIINKPDTLYSKHKTLFLITIFTMTSLIMIIFVLLTIISYRKKMVTVLRDSEERYRDFYENAPDMFHSVNKDGVIIDCNETEARMLGYKKEEIIGRPIADFFSDSTIKIYEQEFPTLKNKRVHLDREREFVRKDGSMFTASLNIFTEVDEHGELIKTKTIARDLTERRRVEELKKSQEQLRSLSAYLEHAREEEKKRIARQIHDELGHALTTLSLDLSWLEKRFAKDGESPDIQLLISRTRAMSELIDATVKTVQRISSELIPGVLEHLGLSEAIKWQLDKFRKRTGIMCDLRIDPENIMLRQNRSLTVFRIFQESLTNIIRHSEATDVHVVLQEADESLSLEVRDNGKGLQESQIGSPESLGLIGIRERARILGGSVRFSCSPGSGTTVKVTIPFDDNGQGS